MTTSPAVDQRRFRDTVGRFATGVTVITVNDGRIARGMTANAFSSLSLDPTLLLVCVDKGATAHPVLERAGAFAVNILAADQIEVSRTFSRKGVEDMADVPHRSAVTGAPIIEGVVAWMDCRIQERLEGGDHSIFIGRVVELDIARPEADPLLFYAGGYREMGGPVTAT